MIGICASVSRGRAAFLAAAGSLPDAGALALAPLGVAAALAGAGLAAAGAFAGGGAAGGRGGAPGGALADSTPDTLTFGKWNSPGDVA
jgi:hypothetical protein